jgi:hypothetical protein
MPIVFWELGSGRIGTLRDPRIIVRTVQPTIRLNRLANHGCDFCGVGDIDAYKRRFTPILCDHMHGLLSPVFVHIGDDQLGTFSGKGESGGSANA